MNLHALTTLRDARVSKASDWVSQLPSTEVVSATLLLSGASPPPRSCSQLVFARVTSNKPPQLGLCSLWPEMGRVCKTEDLGGESQQWSPSSFVGFRTKLLRFHGWLSHPHHFWPQRAQAHSLKTKWAYSALCMWLASWRLENHRLRTSYSRQRRAGQKHEWMGICFWLWKRTCLLSFPELIWQLCSTSSTWLRPHLIWKSCLRTTSKSNVDAARWMICCKAAKSIWRGGPWTLWSMTSLLHWSTSAQRLDPSPSPNRGKMILKGALNESSCHRRLSVRHLTHTQEKTCCLLRVWSKHFVMCEHHCLKIILFFQALLSEKLTKWLEDVFLAEIVSFLGTFVHFRCFSCQTFGTFGAIFTFTTSVFCQLLPEQWWNHTWY